jgi:hypothetical protein
MKRIYLLLSVLTLLFIASCTSYQEKEYGPIAYQMAFEDGDDFLFEGPVEAITTIPFKPEDFGFSKESVGGMKLKNITITTTNTSGFGIFENIKIEVSSKNTEMLTIGVLNNVTDTRSLTIEGLEEAKIKNFNQVDEFYLHISGNLTEGLEEKFEISGELLLSVESSEE